jgi:hypothetical protein
MRARSPPLQSECTNPEESRSPFLDARILIQRIVAIATCLTKLPCIPNRESASEESEGTQSSGSDDSGEVQRRRRKNDESSSEQEEGSGSSHDEDEQHSSAGDSESQTDESSSDTQASKRKKSSSRGRRDAKHDSRGSRCVLECFVFLLVQVCSMAWWTLRLAWIQS